MARAAAGGRGLLPWIAVAEQINLVIKGKDHQVRLALCCMLAQGHLLIEDLPGLGKTTLAQALAQALALDFRRVQFTNDMLPADVLGFSIFDREGGSFKFSRGPIFTQLLLADEINRASPKTQSALLEAMEEGQVSVDGQTWELPQPFFVIATQNPHSSIGAYMLPESQLDRFLMCISIGYPDRVSERAILSGADPRRSLGDIASLMDADGIMAAAAKMERMTLADAVLDYVQRLVASSRAGDEFVTGVSPRGAMALLRCARAWAFLHGRDYVSADDIQAVIWPVFGHRLKSRTSGDSVSSGQLQKWLETVDVLG